MEGRRPLAPRDPEQATADYAATFHDVEARRAVWRGAAMVRWAAAAEARDEIDRLHNTRLAEVYAAHARSPS